MGVNAFIHVANILLVLAYSVRDILWLRVFAVLSSLIALPYFVLQPTPQRAPIVWGIVFIGINLYQAVRLILERRPVQMTREEEEVRRLAFPDLSPRKVLEILSIGSWNTAEPGEQLIERGKRAESMALIVEGKVKVTNENGTLAELGAGDVVGSALLLSGVVADVDAFAVERVRNVRWFTGTLERYLNGHPETRSALQRHLVNDLTDKVRQMSSAHGQIPRTAN